MKEKPKLKIVVEKIYYTLPKSTDNFATFFATFRFENKGGRNTTVHSLELHIEYQGKSYSPLAHPNEIIVVADDVKQVQINFLFPKYHRVIPVGTLTNAKLKISHTYGSEDIIIKEIKQK